MFTLFARCWVAVTLIGFCAAASAENWPGWRGPRGDGTSLEQGVPTRWSATENVLWKTAIPGKGHSSPIVWGERIFLLTAIEEKQERCVVCLDRSTGSILWQRTVVVSPLEPKHKLNNYASSTPATDGELVYVTFLDRDKMLVAAYDFDGNRKWLVRPGPFFSKHGFCSSPVLFGQKVIVNGDHDGDSYIVALDRQNGRTLWMIERENKTRSYCTPIVRRLRGRTQMILSGNKCVASYDPNTGARHWYMDGPTEQMVASLVYNEKADMLFCTGGFPELHILGINPNGTGNVTRTHIVWRSTKGVSYVPSPISVGDFFIVVNEAGILTCYRAANGEIAWSERLPGTYHASLVSAGGLVYCLSDQGVTTVAKPGPPFEVVAINELGEKCFASPAISEGQLFLRSFEHLFCIGRRNTVRP
ncbi:MAG: PQQ-like beta-propeller repeat protein [Verrucomicrobiae bacterium]|nr:PQQ-like beta-propeller repeat protein [Verrucomicrobiae bacterium]